MRTVLLPLLLAACRPIGVSLPPVDSEPPGDSSSDTDPDTGGSEQIGENPGGDDPSAWIFSGVQVWELELEIAEDQLLLLGSAPTEYAQGNIIFNGERLDDVGIRLKGRLGSFRELTGKAAFKIDLNRYVAGQELHGLEKLTLNNMVVDCSCAKEYLAFRVFRALGVPAPRAGFVWLSVNGHSYGLYSHVESVDDEFLQRHFEQPEGNLYEGEYLLYDWGGYLLADFEQGADDLFDLEEGIDVGLEDVHAVTATLDDVGGSSGFYTYMTHILDWPAYHRMMAAEQWAGHSDGYSLNSNNFRVYFDPGDEHRAAFIPWDMDYSFLRPSDWGQSWHYTIGRITNLCVADPECKADYLQLLDSSCDTLDALDLGLELEATLAAIEPYIDDDPRRECSDSYVDYYQGLLRSWLLTASDNARGTW